ncbi:hypothetical protein L3Q82_025362, partial [Scortum barcoo]
MKCFERIVLKHIKDIIPAGLDQYQFAYRSTEDAVSIALHTALTHLQLPNTYVRMLFVDFSSAFNTVIPDKLILKLHNLGTALIAVPLDQETSSPTGLRCKTKEVIVDYKEVQEDRARSSPHPVEHVNNIKFLGIHITCDLTWSMNTAHL